MLNRIGVYMNSRSKHLKRKFRLIFTSFGVLVVLLSVAMIYCAYKGLFKIDSSDWLNMLFAWISSASAFFLGLIVYWQNERFKIETDTSTEKSEEKSEEYQKQLLAINNRLIKLEENKEYTYIAFTQAPVFVGNQSKGFITKGKTYTSGISNTGSDFTDCAVFVFQITNQTDIPIRYLQIKELKISYADYGNDKKTENIATYGEGGFIPSPFIEKGEGVNYVLLANKLQDLVENIPEGMEINLKVIIEVVSIYDRAVNQIFLLRLQRKNAFFDAGGDKNLFWNYCYESTPERK